MILLASNLRYLRKQHRLKQGQIAEEVGINRTTIANYETGVSRPGLEVLLKIAAYYRVNVQDLLTKDLHEEQTGEYAAIPTPNDTTQFWAMMEQLKAISEDVQQVRGELSELRKQFTN
jgi:transcriptional regulator with XRE-family HTH domain